MEELLMPISGSTEVVPELSFLGLGYRLLVSAEQTDGQYELMKFVVPHGLGPPRHCHHHEDECYYILDGQFEAIVGDKTLNVGPGDYLHLPRHVPHGIRNIGPSDGSFLCWVIPGNLGRFFERLVQPANSSVEPMLNEGDIQHLLRVAEEFGIELMMQ